MRDDVGVGSSEEQAEEEEDQNHFSQTENLEVVDNSPPPEDFMQQNDLPAVVAIEGERYLVAQRHRTFYNTRFRINGYLYRVSVVDRPLEEDCNLAFVAIMVELETILHRTIPADDYIQLIFTSTDLNNPFILPIV